MALKKRILLVEDEPEYGAMVKMRLESAGYDVSVAGDAYEGGRAVLRNSYDLVILDLMMPMGGGGLVLSKMRSIPAKAHVPVAFLTAKRVDDKMMEFAKANDVSVIFSKPYDADEFLEIVASLVAGPAADTSSTA